MACTNDRRDLERALDPLMGRDGDEGDLLGLPLRPSRSKNTLKTGLCLATIPPMNRAAGTPARRR